MMWDEVNVWMTKNGLLSPARSGATGRGLTSRALVGRSVPRWLRDFRRDGRSTRRWVSGPEISAADLVVDTRDRYDEEYQAKREAFRWPRSGVDAGQTVSGPNISISPDDRVTGDDLTAGLTKRDDGPPDEEEEEGQVIPKIAALIERVAAMPSRLGPAYRQDLLARADVVEVIQEATYVETIQEPPYGRPVDIDCDVCRPDLHNGCHTLFGIQSPGGRYLHHRCTEHRDEPR